MPGEVTSSDTPSQDFALDRSRTSSPSPSALLARGGAVVPGHDLGPARPQRPRGRRAPTARARAPPPSVPRRPAPRSCVVLPACAAALSPGWAGPRKPGSGRQVVGDPGRLARDAVVEPARPRVVLGRDPADHGPAPLPPLLGHRPDQRLGRARLPAPPGPRRGHRGTRRGGGERPGEGAEMRQPHEPALALGHEALDLVRRIEDPAPRPGPAYRGVWATP